MLFCNALLDGFRILFIDKRCWRLFRYFSANVSVLCGLVFAAHVSAVEPPDPGNNLLSDAQPYLGIYEEFGRWENGIVPVAYNHSGAPENVSQSTVEKNLLSALDMLENLAELHFDYQGLTSNSVHDTADNVVVIGWENSVENFAGRATPIFSSDHADKLRLGYYPYVDGSVIFNSLYSQVPSVQIIVHEVMHMLGLGHSDSPASILHPYSYLYDFPQADDIAGLQAMYGPPDMFSQLGHVKDFEIGAPISGLSLYEPGSYYYVESPGAEYDPFAPIRTITAVTDEMDPDDVVYFRVSHYGTSQGMLANVYLTTPNGYVLKNPSFNIPFTGSGFSYFLGTVGQLLEVPGTWQMDLSLNFKLFVSRNLDVIGEPTSKNKAPSAALNASFDGDQSYKLELTVDDPEQDPVIISWYAPEQEPLINANPVYFINPQPGNIVQVFAHVKDDVIRDPADTPAGSVSGRGFGALHSRFVAIPPRPGVPTYFADKQILHIPEFNIDGQVLRVNLKLTQLSGVVFKFVEFDYVGIGGANELAALDLLTGELLLSTLGIVVGDAYSEVGDVRLVLMPESDPVKFTLQ